MGGRFIFLKLKEKKIQINNDLKKESLKLFRFFLLWNTTIDQWQVE